MTKPTALAGAKPARRKPRAQAASHAEAADAHAPTKALRSALRVLAQFADGKPNYTVTELAAAVGMSASQVSKILAAIADAGFISQDANSHSYAVASRAFALGSQYFNHDRLAREALPVLRALTEETGHSSRLSVPEGERVLYLIGINGRLFIDSPWRIGTYVGFHSSSAGQVLLAFMEAQRSEQLLAQLPLPAITDITITERAQLRKRIAQVRSQGHASHRGENTAGLAATGVPVFAGGGRIVGVISLTYPAHVVGAADEAALLVPLRRAARTLSQRMGCAVYPFG